VGYVTRGAGITAHALGCRNLPADAERYVACRWETLTDATERLACKMEVICVNRIGLLSDITGALAKRHLNISCLTSGPGIHGSEVKVGFVLEVPDLFVLADVMRELEQMPGIMATKRV
jgi:(p)ppGpp synthase/HD superfamily hydrolase